MADFEQESVGTIACEERKKTDNYNTFCFVMGAASRRLRFLVAFIISRIFVIADVILFNEVMQVQNDRLRLGVRRQRGLQWSPHPAAAPCFSSHKVPLDFTAGADVGQPGRLILKS